jgi:hypothetical protein
MGTDETDLSTLAGARVGTVGATLRTRRQETELQPLETGTSGGATAYLKVEKPRFLFLEGSAGAAVAPVVTTAALPDASTARAASSTDRPAAGASASTTGTCSSAASAALGEGARDSTSQPPPSLSSSSSSPDDEFSGVAGGESPCCSRSRYSSSAASDAPAAGFSSPSYAPPSLAPAAARCGRPLGHGASVDPIVRRPRSPSTNDIRQNQTGTPRETERKGEAYLPAGRREA